MIRARKLRQDPRALRSPDQRIDGKTVRWCAGQEFLARFQRVRLSWREEGVGSYIFRRRLLPYSIGDSASAYWRELMTCFTRLPKPAPGSRKFVAGEDGKGGRARKLAWPVLVLMTFKHSQRTHGTLSSGPTKLLSAIANRSAGQLFAAKIRDLAFLAATSSSCCFFPMWRDLAGF